MAYMDCALVVEGNRFVSNGEIACCNKGCCLSVSVSCRMGHKSITWRLLTTVGNSMLPLPTCYTNVTMQTCIIPNSIPGGLVADVSLLEYLEQI